MMDSSGAVQALAPVLPPMARARTAYVVPGTRSLHHDPPRLGRQRCLHPRLAPVPARLHLIRLGVDDGLQPQQRLRGAVVHQPDDGRVVQGRGGAGGAHRQIARAQQHFQVGLDDLLDFIGVGVERGAEGVKRLVPGLPLHRAAYDHGPLLGGQVIRQGLDDRCRDRQVGEGNQVKVGGNVAAEDDQMVRIILIKSPAVSPGWLSLFSVPNPSD